MPHLQPTYANGMLAAVLFLFAALLGCNGSQVHNATVDASDATTSRSLFEQATHGFPTCDMGDLFIDEYTRTSSSPYLEAIEDFRCNTSDTLVTYCIDEQFLGLAVDRLAVPRTTLPVFALYFDADLETARSTLMAKLGKDFRESAESQFGVAPELVQDPADASASVLICTKPD
ncbi:hypothetical protein ACW7GZ_04000 [Luteimonas sp. A537]